jgi:Holliday junction resolvase RusA-like endonuclease
VVTAAGKRRTAGVVRKSAKKLPGTVLASGAMVSIVLPYPRVSGNHATFHGKNSHHTNSHAIAYRGDVRLAVKDQGVFGIRLQGPLEVTYVFVPPDRIARDSCNVIKVLKDALTRADVWVDDSNKIIHRETIEWQEPTIEGGCVSMLIRQL